MCFLCAFYTTGNKHCCKTDPNKMQYDPNKMQYLLGDSPRGTGITVEWLATTEEEKKKLR